MRRKWKVMISAPYMIPVVEEYRAELEARGAELVVPEVRERLSEDELVPLVRQGIHGVICGDDRFTERVLEAATELQVISKWGTGIDSIDGEAARRRGIAVRNTPGAFTEPVADTVFAFILAFARRIPWVDAAIRRGVWYKEPGVSLGECTLGIVGVGDIGRAVLRRAVPFGMTLLGNDIREIPTAFTESVGASIVSLEELLERADFVSLNCDLNPTSHHLIGRAELALMKPSAYLINTARGPIIDEAALVDALSSGEIAGAGLDVFEEEPLPVDSPLREMDNCLLAPHNSNSSPHAWRLVHENSIRNLFSVLESPSPERI